MAEMKEIHEWPITAADGRFVTRPFPTVRLIFRFSFRSFLLRFGIMLSRVEWPGDCSKIRQVVYDRHVTGRFEY